MDFLGNDGWARTSGIHGVMDPVGIVDQYTGRYGADLNYQGQMETNSLNHEMFHEANDFSADQARIGREFSQKEAKTLRRWQMKMSNSAVQRRVEDMKKAGINPLLSVSGASSGASTPSGGMGSGTSAHSVGPPKMDNPMAGYLNIASGIQSAVSSAIAATRTMDDLKTSAVMRKSEATKVLGIEADNFAKDLDNKLKEASFLSEKQRTVTKSLYEGLIQQGKYEAALKVADKVRQGKGAFDEMWDAAVKAGAESSIDFSSITNFAKDLMSMHPGFQVLDQIRKKVLEWFK